MKKYWEFYENLNEIVYAADMDSYELVYMNARARELYGVTSPEEMKGKKCHELLQGCAQPCAICNNKRLKPDSFIEYERYHPMMGRMFSVKDTMVEENGKRYRFELAIDMGIHNLQGRTDEIYIENEAMINEGLRISLSAATPEQSIETLLEYLGQFLNGERIYIFEEKEGNVYDNTYEWCANGVTAQKGNLQAVPHDVVKSWYQAFRNRDNVIIEERENIRSQDPVVYQYLCQQDIQSLVVSPLVHEGKILGFYGVDNPPGELINRISNVFQIMGHFIVSLLRRRNLVQHLEKLSYYDQLTQLGNRHALQSYITEMKPEQSIGILYCDVMGLKRANDVKGHQEGDHLLIRVGECLTKEFGDYALFRIGGDEFLALCSGITEEELKDRVEALKNDMQEQAAFMAVGYIWRPDSKEDMDILLAQADRRMYEDKKAYYAGR